ncbi:membrane fusion protein, multidrug efflux system [Zhouia amylolytica]|uniref:Efflux transporter, RND family, MFP subunit n=2 Tax=Zhouia amylolytica TaxID=376730 RepID=W2UMK4_9FLAO|nr:efflux RND transporter periplasmic adaptor subunit [Zhouia amylolytica]ETN94696.1 efflux transporter, RND family, MFP subunit [Zhouia amylolytica AD3]MCQ0110878.1 efflux RND transporter periplasmic adaptor subunit [Zhouia amylolytica]SFS75381.1 membrane fusion protein, multidrug efflux system [Zhouia amylolytica]
MRKQLLNVSLILASAAILISCGNSEAKQQAAPGAMPYPTVKVEKRSVKDHTSYPASIEGIVNSKVRAKVSGYIQEVLVDEGEVVKKGQRMFRLETQSLSQDAEAAKARVNVAQVEVDKLKPLVEKDIISPVQLETAKANLEQAKSTYRSIVANIDYANIKSPVNGVVGSIPFRKGNLVSPQDAQPLTTVSDINEVYAYFSLNEKELISFMRNMKGNTLDEKAKNIPEVQLELADGSIYGHPGKIETITGEVNPNTGTVSFRATFKNPEGLLRNGSSGKILLPRHMDDALVVPELSTFEQQGKRFVYVVENDSLVTKAITSAAETNGLLVITEGLQEGDQILAKGVSKVRPGTKIVPQPTSIDSIVNSFNKVFK